MNQQFYFWESILQIYLHKTNMAYEYYDRVWNSQRLKTTQSQNRTNCDIPINGLQQNCEKKIKDYVYDFLSDLQGILLYEKSKVQNVTYSMLTFGKKEDKIRLYVHIYYTE